ncbi:hypothetical protein [Bradyrhizobium brasilense]|nr:hypothetical protein [Bradyrhizobium brasilense]
MLAPTLVELAIRDKGGARETPSAQWAPPSGNPTEQIFTKLKH